MKSCLSYSIALLLALCLGLASLNLQGVDARLVRGDHRPRTLKHFSMHARQLMKDEDKGKDAQKAEEEDDDEEEEDDEPEEEEDDEPVEEDDEPMEETLPPVESGVEVPDEEVTNMTTPEEPMEEPMDNATDIMEGETFTVALQPFSLTIDGAIDEEDINLEAYLLGAMQPLMPNLVSVDLTMTVVSDDEPMEDSNATRTRSLRSYQIHRVLQVQTYYFEGTATFEGPPARAADEVDAFLTYALEDIEALQAHLSSTSTGDITVTGATPGDAAPTTVPAVETSETETDNAVGEEDGLSTTGLSIVIVAAVIGGLSLLIILMVGLTGPSGAAGSSKGGLPEQPLE